MAFSITPQCIRCDACKIVCPTSAIYRADNQLNIGHRCDECESLIAPQCASICPIENAIFDSNGNALNPSGSLLPSPTVLINIQQCQEDTL